MSTPLLRAPGWPALFCGNAGRCARALPGAALAALLGSAALRPASAQSSVLVSPSVLVLPLRTLDFASVLPGIPKFVDAVDPRGGVLEVRGDPARQVRISLSLPAVILSSGGVFLPVVYGTSDGILSTTFDPTSGARFDPNAIRVACFNPGTGSLFVFLGGRVLPRATQRRGSYAGTVVATVTYTGIPCP